MARRCEALITFYQTGETADREAYDIAWVQDKASPVDTINGFIEVYLDARGMKGAWEALVFYVNHEKTAEIQKLAADAQWFEDRMPWDPKYRKQGVQGITANAIDVVIETGDSGRSRRSASTCRTIRTIREQYGSKSVSLSNVNEAYDKSTLGRVPAASSAWTPEEAARAEKWSALAGELTTNMHEVIGHASGKIAERLKGNPQAALKEQYSALEEARADLVALYFLPDPKLVELGLVDGGGPRRDRAAPSTRRYTRNALVQLRRVREGTQIEEDHMRNRQMIVRWLMANTKAIDVRDARRQDVLRDGRCRRRSATASAGCWPRSSASSPKGDYDAAAKRCSRPTACTSIRRCATKSWRASITLNLPSYTGFVHAEARGGHRRRRRRSPTSTISYPHGSDDADAGVLRPAEVGGVRNRAVTHARAGRRRLRRSACTRSRVGRRPDRVTSRSRSSCRLRTTAHPPGPISTSCSRRCADRLAGRAIQALGRLERRDVITDLLPYLAAKTTRGVTATALGLSIRGPALDGVPHGQQERAVLDALLAAGDLELALPDASALTPITRALGRLPFEEVELFKSAETFLRKVLERPFPAPRGRTAHRRRPRARVDGEVTAQGRDARRGNDGAAADHRAHARAQPGEPAAERRWRRSSRRRASMPRRSRLCSRETTIRCAGWRSWRSPAPALRSKTEDRIGYIRKALSDSSYMVRLEAVRAWTRRGVRSTVASRSSMRSTIRAGTSSWPSLDALGDVCREDESITSRLASEVAHAAAAGAVAAKAHAFVSLAKRDRERAAISMLTFAMHPTWQVRMYAARAAAIRRRRGRVDAPGVGSGGQRRRGGAGAVAPPEWGRERSALHRSPESPDADRPAQHRAALRGHPHGRAGARQGGADAGARPGTGRRVERITAEQCETSRDTRLALIDRLAQLGRRHRRRRSRRCSRISTPRSRRPRPTVVTQWTGKVAEIDTPHEKSTNIPTLEELSNRVRVSFEMDNGRRFDVQLDALDAPLARTRFLAGVRTGYYNNLTFHRVVPNFVVQGGSPGANEYCGDCPFMRDEVGRMHERGTIGISTRGPDTGDAQIFINLVDNPRLDFDYTVFARVCTGMAVVDEIVEGDRIAQVQILPPSDNCGG